TALHYHFRSSGHYTSSSATGFMSQVIANLEDGRPVALAVNGAVDHAVVADGYASQYGLVHINYGWDGDNNGWYDITGAFLPGYSYTILGALKGIVPNPMISEDIDWIDEDSFELKWLTSHRLFADHFELQQKLGSGNWITLNSAITDTSILIDVNSPGTYKYQVRANRDNIWWDWSREFTISIGNDVTVEFIIDMQDRPLIDGEALVLLGNIDPLGNVQNSPEFTYQSNGIYTTEVTFENSYVGETLAYRFGVSGAGNPDIETFNREYDLNAQPYQSLDTSRFNIPVSITGPVAAAQPETFALGPVYPNPFNATLNLPLQIEQSGIYEIQIFDLNGKARGNPRVQNFSNGSHQIQIDFNILQLASGVYFIRVKHADISQITKCQLLK
ncbi:MAG: C10 family peptidase, partial [Candidatus Marinimicrobia bacterium]|nr:C10 family peptidase [Candidatus Neomarinimicrobiota bacterium]